MRTLLSIALSAVLWMSSTAAHAEQKHYLGGAYNLDHCCRIAESAGYTRCTFGGYVGGLYYYNACFGSYKSNNGGLNPSFAQWENAARFVSIDTNLFAMEIMDHDGYKDLRNLADDVRSAIKTLIAAGEDGLPNSAIRRHYEDFSRAYSALSSAYYPVHAQLQNAKVEKAWRSLAEAATRLDRDIQ